MKSCSGQSRRGGSRGDPCGLAGRELKCEILHVLRVSGGDRVVLARRLSPEEPVRGVPQVLPQALVLDGSFLHAVPEQDQIDGVHHSLVKLKGPQEDADAGSQRLVGVRH